MKKRENWSGLSESFIAGTIAIVFLLVGYQTALFIHRASVVKIVANRDEPDTVFVFGSFADAQDGRVREKDDLKSCPDYVGNVMTDGNVAQSDRNGAGNIVVMEMKTAGHSPRAKSVRASVPRSKVENFRFDPNSVSLEDLCRLGFTPKQAQSIDNYVVSDSIYRRLEPFIDIPLTDLNLADSSALDALPGIGGWYASKIIEYRNALGGYSYKEQLMDIQRFDEEKYEALEDLITVSPEHQTPYPLWTLPADSLRLHPYIDNIETARAIVLFRENSPKDRWTVEVLAETGILSQHNAMRLSQCLISVPE